MIFRDGRLPRDLKYEVMIDLNSMTIAFHWPRGGGGFLVGLLRRLSTEAYAINPCDLVPTNWKWYWKDNGNVWHMYDKDYTVSLYPCIPLQASTKYGIVSRILIQKERDKILWSKYNTSSVAVHSGNKLISNY